MDQTSEFVRLWTQFHRDVERYVYSMVPRSADAAEVVQVVSVKLWEKWENYDQERPYLPWAMRFAYLEILNWRQRLARERLVFSHELLEQLHSTDEELDQLIERKLTDSEIDYTLKTFGPLDEPHACLQLRQDFAEKTEIRHAFHELTRAAELATTRPDPVFFIAELFVSYGLSE